MSQPSLTDLQVVLQSTLGDGLAVKSCEVKDLIPPGENYGSKIVSLHIAISINKVESDLYLVGKLPPPTIEQRQMFDSPRTFRKEIFMYSKLLPFYQKLEIESGINREATFDLAPKYYGSQLSSGSADEFDDNAMILIENLKMKGFYCVDRRVGCDLVHAKLTVRAMARFHALGMAAKEKNSEFFELLKVQSKCIEIANPEDWGTIVAERIQDIRKDPKIEEHFGACIEGLKSSKYETWLATPGEPWSTIIHADFWANNIMYRDDGDGDVVDVKFIDFQNYLHLSPMRELTYFVSSGLDHDTIEHVDELIDLYYDSLIERLRMLNCDVIVYTRETFDRQLREDAKMEFSHGLSMVKIITLDIDPANPDCRNLKNLVQFEESNEAYRRKLRDLVMTYVRKGWLED